MSLALRFSGSLRPASARLATSARPFSTEGVSSTAYEKDIYEMPERNSKLRVKVNTFNGSVYVHVRRHFKPEGSEDWFPTKKGIVLNVTQFENLASSIGDIREEVARWSSENGTLSVQFLCYVESYVIQKVGMNIGNMYIKMLHLRYKVHHAVF